MQWPRWSEAVLALVALVVAGMIGYGARAGTSAAPGRLTVSASGTAQVLPNEAQISVGANTVASTAQGALAKLNAIAEKIVAAVQKQGIPEQDVQTSNLNVGQNYGPNGRLSGYQANEQFTVTVRKLASTSAVIAAAMGAGANQFNNVSFSESDPNAGQQAAVQTALAAAKRQAKSEAAELGVTLVRVVSVRLAQPQSPGPIFASYKAAASASAPVVQPGNQTVSVQVQVTYSYR